LGFLTENLDMSVWYRTMANAPAALRWQTLTGADRRDVEREKATRAGLGIDARARPELQAQNDN
jgi:hypothetical protein